MSVSAHKVNIYVANLARIFTGPQHYMDLLNLAFC